MGWRVLARDDCLQEEGAHHHSISLEAHQMFRSEPCNNCTAGCSRPAAGCESVLGLSTGKPQQTQGVKVGCFPASLQCSAHAPPRQHTVNGATKA
eukprot:1157777-Pelagomonas_calceolata.AAC.6